MTNDEQRIPTALVISLCEPYNGKVAYSAYIAAWLFRRLLKSPLYGKHVTEQQLIDYITEIDPRYIDHLKREGVLT